MDDDSNKPVPVEPLDYDQPSLQEMARSAEIPTRPHYRMSKLERMQCWPEVLAMLENGDTVSDIATYIQTVRQEYLEVCHGNLGRVIYKWINRHPEMVSSRLPTIHLELAATAPNIDPLVGLNLIFALQIDRVNVLYAIEKRTRTVNPRTEKEIRLANEILRTMGELESKKKRYSPQQPAPTGSVMTQLDQLRDMYKNKYGAAIAQVALSDESRRKVLNALEHIRRGDSGALRTILERNDKKAAELEERERQRAMDEADTLDVEPTNHEEGE